MKRLAPAAAALALCLLLAPAPSSGAAGKRAFEISDLYRTAAVGGPVVSPDGARVAFTVRRADLDSAESWTELWAMAPDGSGLRQMTFSRAGARHHDTDPLFTPDGRNLLFVSSRSDSSQLWTMPVDGGEPRQLTDYPLDLADPAISPDGRWIAVTAEVYPECGADADCNEKIAEAVAAGALQVYVADELLYRHWTDWRNGRWRHVLLVDAATGKVERDLTPGRFDSPTFSLGGGRGYEFSPDGRELIVVSNHDPDPASSTNSDLWAVPLAGDGAPVNLTGANDGWDGAPLFSPDGRSLAFVSQAMPGNEADLFRLAVLDRASGAVRYLTSRDGFDDWVDDMAWLPDGSGLVFQAQVEGRTPLYRIPAAGGTPVEILRHGLFDGWALTPDGGAVLYSRRTVGEPSEIFRAAAAAGAEKTRLTRFNADLEAEVDIRPVEELWVEGDGGTKVQVFVVKPHGFDPAKKYPLILNVHGGPQTQWADAYRGDWQVYPGKGYVVAFPNPAGSSGFGQDFVDAIGCDWGGRVYRDVMKVTDAVAALPYVDAKRMGAMGWSYGGYMMMWLAGHTDRFQALASMMGVYDLEAMYGATEELWFVEKDLCGTPWESPEYDRWTPSAHVAKFKTPTLVLTGERDYRVPYTQSLQFFTALQKRGVPSRLVVFPDSGHWPGWQDMAFYYNAHVDWFHRWLGGGAPTWDLTEQSRNLAYGPQAKGDDGGREGG